MPDSKTDGPSPGVPPRPSPPTELVEFLKKGEPLSLLITGSPGTGKTTLALSLLATLDQPSFYLATRVGRGNLLHHFPWLAAALPRERLIDLEDVRPTADRQEDLMGQLDQLVAPLDPLSAGRKLRDFLHLPEALSRSLSEPPARAGRRVLMIDSWEGLVEPYVHLLGLDESGRSTLDHGLLALFQSADCALVLTCESPSTPSLEYLVDGVVQLHSEMNGGFVARYLALRKLRGFALSTTSYAFTLHDGRFTTCPPIHPRRAVSQSILARAILDPHPSQNPSFGIPFLDETLGPVHPGDTILAALDATGSSAPLGFIMYPFWASVARAGWQAAFMMDLAHDPRVGRGLITGGEPIPDLNERFRFLPSNPKLGPDGVWAELLGAVQPRTAIDVSVHSLASYLQEPGEGVVARVSQLQRRAREQGALLVLVARTSDPFLSPISTMVRFHLGISAYHGTYLVSGRAPQTASMVVAEVADGPTARTTQFLPMT
jgi:KaiC/GvpD/RAD55 family RecA-like ATPase